MVKYVDTREREEEILNLLIRSYIKDSKPISSTYLCENYNLPYSSATVRNILENLEKKGYLSHIHTSSGRVPTKEGFKYYVEHLSEDEILKSYSIPSSLENLNLNYTSDLEEIVNYTLDILAQLSGYASMLAFFGKDEKIFFKGARFILEQPEFEDIKKLKNLFYTLEVKLSELQNLLFNYLDEKIKIIIGDDIGFEEISDCSLVISGSQEKNLSFVMALLGPIRMDYIKAASYLYSIKNKLENIIECYE